MKERKKRLINVCKEYMRGNSKCTSSKKVRKETIMKGVVELK